MLMRWSLMMTMAVLATWGWGQTPGRWTMTETTGKTSQTIQYFCQLAENGGTLTVEKGTRTLMTVFDDSGRTVRWTKASPAKATVDLTLVGKEFVVHTEEGSTRFPGTDLPWFQDLNQLGPLVVGSETKVRFTAFADFLDARLRASDMTTFVATKVRKEAQKWGTGEGDTWRVRVTFDDFRSAFWGATYWFRASDGRLVRFEEVRGAPGTPTTVGVLTEEQR